MSAGSKESPQLCHLLPTPRPRAVPSAGQSSLLPPHLAGHSFYAHPSNPETIVKEHSRAVTPMAGSGGWGRAWTTLLPAQVSGNRSRALPAPLTHRTPSSGGACPQGWVALVSVKGHQWPPCHPHENDTVTPPPPH